MKYNPAYGSHLPILVKVLQISEGPVLELGSGYTSTPVMHWLCLEAKRRLVTYENNPQIFEVNKSFASGLHEVRFTDNWDEIPIESEHWGVAFIDHEPPERRKTEITRLAKIADYIIVHDTESQRESEFEFTKNSFPLFKYRYNYLRQKPYTTVLSNFIDFYL